jgi:tRNA C32,U32 (ribose-2'-O)-methylase TrmJ
VLKKFTSHEHNIGIICKYMRTMGIHSNAQQAAPRRKAQ